MNMGIMDAIVLAKSIASGDLERYAKQRHADASDWVRLNRRISTIALDSTASSLRLRRIITTVLPILAKVMGPPTTSQYGFLNRPGFGGGFIS